MNSNILDCLHNHRQIRWLLQSSCMNQGFHLNSLALEAIIAWKGCEFGKNSFVVRVLRCWFTSEGAVQVHT